LLIAYFVVFGSEFLLKYVCAKPTKEKILSLTDQYLIHIVLHYIPLFLILYISVCRNESVITYSQLSLLILTSFIYFLVNRFDYNKILTENYNIFNNFESMIVQI